MNGVPRTGWATLAADEERYRPLYARALGLRFVNPGGVLCFLFFEGAAALAALLALAELVSWWTVLALPAAVALMVKLNDLVAAAVVRSAALVPEQERNRFRRQVEPAVGRAPVPSRIAGYRSEPGPRGPARGRQRPGSAVRNAHLVHGEDADLLHGEAETAPWDFVPSRRHPRSGPPAG